jgi:hypothetical protein
MAGTETLNVNAEFDRLIASEFGSAAILANNLTPAAGETLPFGAFTEGPVAPEHLRGAMATATGYSGNNGEESC